MAIPFCQLSKTFQKSEGCILNVNQNLKWFSNIQSIMIYIYFKKRREKSSLMLRIHKTI